jgi:DnaD/phage-associated family protein
MIGFTGFPARARQTPLPNLFFTEVLPNIDDLAELKVTLHLFSRLSWKKGPIRFVTLKELSGDLGLMSSLSTGEGDPLALLEGGLRRVLERGTFLHLALVREESTDHLYFLNTDSDRRAILRVQRGDVDLGAMPKIEALPEAPEHRNIYGLYEENIGVLSPLIAEELKDAEERYPYPWIVEAFREAVRLNRRRWRYIQRILENWTTEGRSHGQPGRGAEPVSTGERSPTGRGGYIVKRRRG